MDRFIPPRSSAKFVSKRLYEPMIAEDEVKPYERFLSKEILS